MADTELIEMYHNFKAGTLPADVRAIKLSENATGLGLWDDVIDCRLFRVGETMVRLGYSEKSKVFAYKEYPPDFSLEV
jgi:hypothetical protein